MNKNNGFAYQVLILIIIIIIAVAGVIINKVVGKNGLVNKVAVVEQEYNKEDVLEKINYLVTQKFIELNNQAKQNNQNISELYNSDVIIEYLKQSLIIEEVKDDEGNVQNGIYLIDVNKLNKDNEKQIVQISGRFQLERKDDKYIVVYYNNEQKSQQVGELQIQQI